MSYSRLSLYNEALRICGERRLASLTEDREPRHLLDQVWNDGGVDYCLEQGQWNFAMRAVMIDYDTAVDPNFGYRYGFSKPTDWIRTAAMCSDEYYRSPLLQYFDEPDYWYADISPLYVRYVSNDSSYGGDMSRWPGTFSEFVSSHFASKVVYKLTSDKARILLVEKRAKATKRDALNKDAMNDPTAFPAPGSWVRSRAGSNLTGRDRGSRSNLIG